jgi:SSS family solute:Na+ symporter
MTSGLSSLDIAIVAAYAVILLSLALWVSREKAGHEKNTEDYFLASKSLPWWAIGASLIAANISAEQIIGMSGSGYAIGLAISSYEWMAAITLILVGKYMLPIFLKRGIYTMPQYLEQRYNHSVRMVMAVFWLAVYIFVNLTSVMWLGALAINSITGFPLMYSLIALGTFALAYSLFGGLKAVALTDIIQVVLLIFGGLLISAISLNMIGEGSIIGGFSELMNKAPEKFDMILDKDSPHYASLPGISVLIGGMVIMNFSYWGFNQYIIQRALAAKDINEARKGIAFAAYLKLLMPLIIVVPGIAAFVLYPDLPKSDLAYPEMMKLVPGGLRGLVFAALIAAIVSSLASMANSISTIATMDIYRSFKQDVSQNHLVKFGRIVSVVAVVLAMIAAKPLLGSLDQAFQYIQEYTGFFTPGICVIFTLGMFWKKTSSGGALAAVLGSFLLSIALKLLWPSLPFMDRVGLVFLLCVAAAVVVSLVQNKTEDSSSDVAVTSEDFKTTSGFNIAGLGVAVILVALYAAWW